jgi:hypothetical protein
MHSSFFLIIISFPCLSHPCLSLLQKNENLLKISIRHYGPPIIKLFSSVSTVTRKWSERPGFDSRQGQGRSSSPRHRVQIGSGGPPNLLSNGYRGTLFPGVKRPGRETDHSPPFLQNNENLRKISIRHYGSPTIKLLSSVSTVTRLWAE